MVMSGFATTPDVVRWLSGAIIALTWYDRDNRKLFGTAAVRDAFVAMSCFATTPDAVRWLSNAINSITKNNSENKKLLSYSVAFVLSRLLFF